MHDLHLTTHGEKYWVDTCWVSDRKDYETMVFEDGTFSDVAQYHARGKLSARLNHERAVQEWAGELLWEDDDEEALLCGARI